MRVIKIGGRAQSDANLPMLVGSAWLSGGKRMCVVHGGGDEITEFQNALGRESKFVRGRRVTTDQDLQLLRMVLSGAVNKRLVSAFNSAGVPAAGVSGEDGRLLAAVTTALQEMGAVGEPADADTKILRVLLDAGFLPVISPLAYDQKDGGPLNVNGDDAAAALAAGLNATELVFVADVEGVLDAEGRLIHDLSCSTAVSLVADGIAAGGMIAKLEAANRALNSGVSRVRIAGIAGICEQDAGTSITLNGG